MATTDKTIITTAGRNMLVDLDNNRAHANGFNIYFSTGDLTGMTDDQLVNLQDIQAKDIKEKADIIKLDQGDTKIRAQATYTGTQKGIYINTYATYAVDDQGNEMLFAVYLNSEPQYLLASTNDQETTQGYGFNIGISQTDNVNFTKLSNITATLQDVQQMIDGGDAVSIHSNQTVVGDKNFNGKLQHDGIDVVDSTMLQSAIDKLSDTREGDFAEGRSFNELIGASGVYDINNHNLANYKDNQGLPTDAGNIYGSVIPFAGTGFTTIFVFMANGRTFVAPRSQYVNTAFTELATTKYVDASPQYEIARDENDAYNLANNATKPTLYVYPDSDDVNTISLAKHVNGIYGYGIGNLQPVSTNVTNDNPSKFQFNNVSATYDPNNKQFTLHGSITTIASGNANDNILTLNIDKLGLNEITASSLNNQPVAVDTDTFRKNVVLSASASYASGSTISVEGDTIRLGYDASLKPKVDGRIFGVSWNQGQSSTLTRTDAAVGLQAGVNGAQNDFDKVSVWSQMHRVTDNLGNVFVRIPKFYIKKTQTSGLSTWQVSLAQIDSSWYLPKCFWDFTNSQELPYVDVGAYEGSTINNALSSRTQQSVNSVNSQNYNTIGQFRQLARANGNGYQQYDIHVLDALQVLFIVEFATLDSSQVVGNGNTNGNYNHQNTGMTDSLTASTAITSDTYFFVYRGIENLYGNYYKYVDGISFNNGQIWVCDDANNYADSTYTNPYNQVGYNLPGSYNWIQSQGYDPNHPEVSLPETDTSTQGYYQDAVWSDNGSNYCMLTGGDSLSDPHFGLFSAYCYDPYSYSRFIYASRLVRKPLD